MINTTIKLLKHFNFLTPDLVASGLYSEDTFYDQFIDDLKGSKKEVIIESPYITSYRMGTFRRTFEKLVSKKVKIYVFTRHPHDHDIAMQRQAETEIRNLEMIGVHVIIDRNLNHRKVAILDRKILWEGSLNILSQSTSKEIMRRIDSEELSEQMFQFCKLDKYVY